MKTPTRPELFDTLYDMAAAGGREAALFGDSIRLIRPAFEKMLIGSEFPTVFLEFPLSGKPYLDFTIAYSRVEPGSRFEEGAGYGYQPMFDWYAAAPRTPGRLLGMTMDTGSGDPTHAGAYFHEYKGSALQEAFLASLAEDRRIESLRELRLRMPEGLSVDYLGLFPARPGSFLRIGGYISKALQSAAAQDPAILGNCLSRIGFRDAGKAMLEHCAQFLSLTPDADYQLDLYPDGTLGNTFSLFADFHTVRFRQMEECMNSGFGHEILLRLQKDGAADDRFRQIAGGGFNKIFPFFDEEDKISFVHFANFLLNIKLKFKAGILQPAKCYYAFRAVYDSPCHLK